MRKLMFVLMALLAGPVLAAGESPPAVAAGRFHGCGLRGDAKRKMASDLDVLKNRAGAPDPAELVTLPFARLFAAAEPLPDAMPVRVRVWVRNVKPGGVESANCHAKPAQWRDSHIEAYATAKGAALPVVLEVTPRWRAAMAANGADWSTAALRKALVGHYVEFEGWLLWDAEHVPQSETTNPGHKGNWRQTPLEVHPVTSIRVLQ